MKVKELIEQLQTLNPELKVVIKGTDPTDYDFFNNINGKVKEKNVFLGEEEEIKTKVVVIDGGMF
jgi:hypothetical protein